MKNKTRKGKIKVPVIADFGGSMPVSERKIDLTKFAEQSVAMAMADEATELTVDQLRALRFVVAKLGVGETRKHLLNRVKYVRTVGRQPHEVRNGLRGVISRVKKLDGPGFEQLRQWLIDSDASAMENK